MSDVRLKVSTIAIYSQAVMLIQQIGNRVHADIILQGNVMGKINIDLLETGMILADDVHDRSGRMLLGAGAELTQKHLVIFRTWGVLEADIVGLGSEVAGEMIPADVDPLELDAARERVAPLFRHTNTAHPAIVELLRLAALRKVQHVVV